MNTKEKIITEIQQILESFAIEVKKSSGRYSNNQTFFWEVASSFVSGKMKDAYPVIICQREGDFAIRSFRFTVETTSGCRTFNKASMVTRWRALWLIKSAVETLGHECRIDWIRGVVFQWATDFSVTIVVKTSWPDQTS